ncbi:MAG TPA: CPBP family intramembrane metalloprotease [bacterium]|nr:CPBP family intramembrane metalloprotease [bacterium]
MNVPDVLDVLYVSDKNYLIMVSVVFLSLLAPLSIYVGLIVLNNIPLTLILFHGLICLGIPLMDFTFVQKQTLGHYFYALGFRNVKKVFLPAIMLGVLFGTTIYLFISRLQEYLIDIEKTHFLLKMWNIMDLHPVFFLFIMIFANSVLEEIYWRGYIFLKLEGKLLPKQQILFTAFFYASYHFITTSNLFSVFCGLLFTILIFGIGCFWGVVRQKYDSIYLPIISHLLADLGIMMVYIRFFV